MNECHCLIKKRRIRWQLLINPISLSALAIGGPDSVFEKKEQKEKECHPSSK
jgi:hypothetical protein